MFEKDLFFRIGRGNLKYPPAKLRRTNSLKGGDQGTFQKPTARALSKQIGRNTKKKTEKKNNTKP